MVLQQSVGKRDIREVLNYVNNAFKCKQGASETNPLTTMYVNGELDKRITSEADKKLHNHFLGIGNMVINTSKLGNVLKFLSEYEDKNDKWYQLAVDAVLEEIKSKD